MLRRPVAAVGATLVVCAGLAGTAASQTAPSPLAYDGMAAADGVLMQVRTGLLAALSDTPVNGGGPTAQARADSLGISTGYAAFPDPGRDLLPVPGLIVYVLQGEGVPAPTPPSYPLFVQSDAVSAPEQSSGTGPYRLVARSQAGASEATATSGFASESAGNTALVRSNAAVGPSDEAVVARAESNVQGLSIGPLRLGEVRTVATLTLAPDGTLTPSTELEILGTSVGGIPVTLTPDGVSAAGPSAPLPISPALNDILAGSGITVRVVEAQVFPDQVVAAAVEVTAPFNAPAVPNVGELTGTVTYRLGSAVARLSGIAPDASTPPASTVTGAPDGAAPSSAVTLPDTTSPDASGSVDSSGTAAGPLASTPGSPTNPSVRTAPTAAILRLWDIRSVYLLATACALAIVATGRMIRRSGALT